VIIRIRGGDFCYSHEEIDAMLEDVKYFKSHEANGIVFGALDENFNVDEDGCQKILHAWGHERPATFHRAFDETKFEKIDENVRKIANLGFKRILTSGLEPTAEKGIENIKVIKRIADEVGLIVLPGSGVNKKNASLIVSETSCGEIHGSARSERNIETKLSLGGKSIYVCDRVKVEELKKLFES
jgi:copper homeostasis protein